MGTAPGAGDGPGYRGAEISYRRLLVGLLSNGHILLEGVPGLAKTLALKTLASAIQTGFRRIQFTPDMLPADIVGTEIYNPRDVSFVVKHGPVFTNLILADEINRAPAKVQSALLEAMQERQVTIGENTYRPERSFSGDGHPEPYRTGGDLSAAGGAGRPFHAEGRDYLSNPFPKKGSSWIPLKQRNSRCAVNRVVQAEEILRARQVVNTIYMDEKVKDYIVSLVHATREPATYGLDLKPYIQYGASPRATINLKAASKSLAFLRGRGYVTPEDVKSIAMDVLRHRIGITYEAEAEALTSEDMVTRILETIPVP